MQSGTFEGYSNAQIDKLKKRWEDYQTQKRIQEVLQREIGLVKNEFQDKIKELNEFIETEKN